MVAVGILLSILANDSVYREPDRPDTTASRRVGFLDLAHRCARNVNPLSRNGAAEHEPRRTAA